MRPDAKRFSGQMKVLVTDGDTRPALAVTRALGRLGHEVVVAAESHPTLASVSRYCAAQEIYPSLKTRSEEFAVSIAQIARRRAIDVVIPATEITTLLLAERRDLLPANCTTPLPSTDAILAANDKAHVIALGRELGVPVPATVLVESKRVVPDASMLGYPVVVKPSRSRVRTSTGWASTGVQYARDGMELARMLDSLPDHAYPLLLQERIIGAGVGVFLCFQHGKAVAMFSHRRLREKPPSGGVSVLCESVDLDSLAAAHAVRLLARLAWRGVAMVEFKRDERDASLRLMEINGRLWGSLQLSINAGVNFPALLLAVAKDEPIAPLTQYRVGVRTRWLAGDADVLLMTMLRRHESTQPATVQGRWKAMREFMHFTGQDLHYEVEARGDWAPARLEWRRQLLGA